MTPQAAPISATAPRRRKLWEVLEALGRPKVGLMLALGFSSGLPFMLIGNTLGFWLADAGVKLAAIGLLSWVGLTYSVKFVWGAMVDRIRAPIFSGLGRRRGWMLVSQLLAGAGLIAMGLVDPKAQLAWLVAAALVAAVGAAVQDTAMDAWRIESAADPEELGLMTAAYNLGYRFALILTEAIILMVAKRLGWPLAYVLYGAGMGVGVIAVVFAREPARADAVMEDKSRAAHEKPAQGVLDAIAGPIVAFFRAHGLGMAALMLAAITFYHLCDYMRGPMSNPFYKALDIDKDVIGWTRLFVGTPGSFVGITLGGISALRLGVMRSLLIGALLQPLAIGAFALLGWHGGDWTLAAAGPFELTAFEAIMAFDAFAISYSGVALISYMSTLTSLGYTATQYALLTSALAWTGKILKGFSGAIVEALEPGRTLLDAYALFYVLSAALGLPAILLCLVLSARQKQAHASD